MQVSTNAWWILAETPNHLKLVIISQPRAQRAWNIEIEHSIDGWGYAVAGFPNHLKLVAISRSRVRLAWNLQFQIRLRPGMLRHCYCDKFEEGSFDFKRFPTLECIYVRRLVELPLVVTLLESCLDPKWRNWWNKKMSFTKKSFPFTMSSDGCTFTEISASRSDKR